MSPTAMAPDAYAKSHATSLRRIAATMRKAIDVFRSQSADNQALATHPAMFGAPEVDGVGAAVTMDHAAIAWLLARGYTVKGTAVTP